MEEKREELIYLIARFAVDHDLVLPCASIADYLLANGVTLHMAKLIDHKNCICRMKPVCDETYGSYDFYKSSKEIVGGYPAIFASADENGELIIFAEGDETSGYYHPKFCPECGRILRQGGIT